MSCNPSKKSKTCVCEPCPEDRIKHDENHNPTLSELIESYKVKWKGNLENHLTNFDTITDCVCGAVGNMDAPHPAPFIRKGSHQFCMPTATINEIVPRLNNVKSKNFVDFDELYDYVEEVSKGVEDYGDLAKYDFSLRYGFKRGLKPEKYVYTHRGARAGAEALVKAGLLNEASHKIAICDFPPQLRELGAMHLENFLCIKKEQLKQLKK